MRVLLQGRGQRAELQGGDSAVVSKLVQELQALGHDVEVHAQPPPEGVDGFDVVHAFNLDRSVLTETAALARAAGAAGVRLVMTPLWWPLDRYVQGLPLRDRLAFRVKGAPLARALRDRSLASLRALRRRQAGVLAAAQVVCPSGDAEGQALERRFGRLPLRVVHFGTDATTPAGHPAREGVLCVGRIDPRKNQAALIQALDGTGIRLDLVGSDGVFGTYAQRCRQVAGPNVVFHGYVSQADLEAAYHGTRVHALPSYFELPGLTSLDAAASGAAVVVSQEGTAAEYFGEDARYCGVDVASIRAAVLAAHEAGPPAGLASAIAGHFTWRACAESYLAAYA